MKQIAELILSSRRAITPEGESSATIYVCGGIIADIGPYDPERGDDVGTAVVMPGLVDTHVHLNEPGRADWEGFETGTAAAAAGGISTLVDMPLNSAPVTTNPAALATKRRSANGKVHVDVGFYGGLIPGSERHVKSLLDYGVLGIKAFLCDSGLDEFPAVSERELRAVMPLLAERDVPLLVHAELVHDVPEMADPRRYADYLASRPASFERNAVQMMIELSEATGCHVHIVHLADAGCLPQIRAARQRNVPVTVETCPHYLTFAAEEIAAGATRFKCAPPIRSAQNREELWAGLREGVIDLIASDHSPCPPDMKSVGGGRFDLAWGGISSLQLGLSVVWTEANRRGFTLRDVVRWMSFNPAQLIGITRQLAVEQPAHIVVFEPDETLFVDAEALLHRHKVSPYHGHTLGGVVRKTYIHGVPSGTRGGRLI